jgi:hypothetical protein
MTSISLHMQWNLNLQSHGSFLTEDNWFFIMPLLIKLFEINVYNFLRAPFASSCKMKTSFQEKSIFAAKIFKPEKRSFREESCKNFVESYFDQSREVIAIKAAKLF